MKPGMINPGHPFGLRVPLPEDVSRCAKVQELLKNSGPNAVAMYLATALNMLEEHGEIVRRQRKRLSEFEEANRVQKSTAKMNDKYWAPKDTSDVLEALRSSPARTQPKDDNT